MPTERAFVSPWRGERATGRTRMHIVWGRIVYHAIVDPDVPGVIHRRELVEGRRLEVRHVAGRGARGRAGMGRAVTSV